MNQLPDRFLSKTLVDPTSPILNGSHCHVWTGRIERNGRGRFWFEGKPVLAYRFALAHKLGVALADLADSVAMHLCDNPACVCSSHLQAGTQGENMKDMVAKGRDRWARVEARGRAIQAQKVAKEIRRMDSEIRELEGLIEEAQA